LKAAALLPSCATIEKSVDILDGNETLIRDLTPFPVTNPRFFMVSKKNQL
jgi:hypothetical protein